MFDVVLTAFDGSPSSSEAVAWAADEATARRAGLEIVSWCEVPWVGQPPVTVERVREIAQTTDARLQRALADVRAAHPELTVVGSTCDGRPRGAILDAAAHADLVVVGARRSADGTLHPGATARAVTRHSTAPVVIVPSGAPWDRVERVVVGVDGADDAALCWAAADAERRGVELVLVHADAAGGDDARRVLDAALAKVGAVQGLTVRVVLARSDPAPALLEEAGADALIVVGRRHRNAAAAFALGTCSRVLLRHAAVPVVIADGRLSTSPA
jgi:nucleotide-binding universal stress UspA family protein